tara:strand:- start:34 stop:195 length:162 start_codon:yes stop_codon:yes gene_type:complete
MIHGMEKPLTLSLTIPANHPWGMVDFLPSSLFFILKPLIYKGKLVLDFNPKII